MTQKNDYLIEVFEKIGGPLLAAIESNPEPLKAEDTASAMASLLAKSVQSGIEISHLLGKEGAGTDDAARLATTALAGNLIAGRFKITNKTPEESDLKRIQSALQAVMVFSDNFTPDEDNIKRLENLEPRGQQVDAIQLSAQYIHAVLPIIEAVSLYSFGRQEQAMISIIGKRLSQRALTLRESLSDSADENEQKRLEIAILSALSQLYHTCHIHETQRLTAMDADELGKQPTDVDGGLSMERLWKRFETRALMLEALGKNLILGEDAASKDSGENKAPAPPAPPKEEQKAQPEEPKQPEQKAAEAPPATPPPQETPAQDDNPMAFFGKKPESENTSPTKETPKEAPKETPEKPEADDSNESDSNEDSSDSGSNNSQANPMSFFKKGDE